MPLCMTVFVMQLDTVMFVNQADLSLQKPCSPDSTRNYINLN